MRRLKVPLTAILTMFVLIDLLVGYRLWDSGWPKRVHWTDAQNSIVYLAVERIPFTGIDWLILVLGVGVQVLLFYLVRKAWRASPMHSPALSGGALPHP